MRAEIDPLSPAEDGMRGASPSGGALSMEMLAAQLAPMRTALDKLPGLIEKLVATVEANQAAMLEKMERVADAAEQNRDTLSSAIEGLQAGQQALVDIRDDIDHVAQEVAIRNADYIRERQESEQGS